MDYTRVIYIIARVYNKEGGFGLVIIPPIKYNYV